VLAAGFAATAAGPAAAACIANGTKTLIRTFVSNYNGGRAAGRLWAKEPYFQWFSAAGRYGAKAYDPASLRSADDLGAAGPRPFKGAADCTAAGPILIVWSL